MELGVTERDDAITQVALIGRLDIAGAQAVELRFHALTAARKQPAIVELDRLEFIASLGMGMLISSAKAMQRKGFTMVLVGATDPVDGALRTAGIDQAIPMVDSIADAEKLVVGT